MTPPHSERPAGLQTMSANALPSQPSSRTTDPAPDSSRRDFDPEPATGSDDSEPGPSPGSPAEAEIQVEVLVRDAATLARPLADLARTILARLGVERAQIQVVLTDDARIRLINRSHLDHDWATDVITFPLSEPGDDLLEADLVVSVETARREASTRRCDPLDELGLYIVHGLLHLQGHDDHDPEDRARMRRRESELLVDAGWPDPHAEPIASPMAPLGNCPRSERPS